MSNFFKAIGRLIVSFQQMQPYRVKSLLPTIRQWEKWSLPSKYSGLGCLIGTLGCLIGIITLFFSLSDRFIPETNRPYEKSKDVAYTMPEYIDHGRMKNSVAKNTNQVSILCGEMTIGSGEKKRFEGINGTFRSNQVGGSSSSCILEYDISRQPLGYIDLTSVRSIKYLGQPADEPWSSFIEIHVLQKNGNESKHLCATKDSFRLTLENSNATRDTVPFYDIKEVTFFQED